MRLSGKKVFVTGACGFIGSHLVEHLLDKGADVRAFVYYNAFNSWGWLDTLPKSIVKKIDVHMGNAKDPHGVKKAMKGSAVVFHLAALIGIPFSYHSPDSYVDTNIRGSLNILQAARDLGVDRVIMTSTSEVYGSALYVPIDEKHPLQAQSPYAATKIAADKMAESFYLSFGLPVVIARPFNTYGPRQSVRAIIPTIITQALSDQKAIRLGNIHTFRDMNYVSDICTGLIAVAENDQAIGKTINICSGREVSIEDLARLILKALGSDKDIETEECRVRPKGSEVERLLGDNTLICSLTGWKPQCSLEDGIVRTVEWFRAEGKMLPHKAGLYAI
ncbi:MAG: GDP-mannose 4,6-dehydratase [Candidatus Omnitrophica bacterium]|nr:GDP-mannose 4,6-dehydratase [Candidatus Omnitrophota bacterium]MCM8790623.1 GDP-mannose 4,6-dehydratase [Candidatus Omnitrophota bacterium]